MTLASTEATRDPNSPLVLGSVTASGGAEYADYGSGGVSGLSDNRGSGSRTSSRRNSPLVAPHAEAPQAVPSVAAGLNSSPAARILSVGSSRDIPGGDFSGGEGRGGRVANKDKLGESGFGGSGSFGVGGIFGGEVVVDDAAAALIASAEISKSSVTVGGGHASSLVLASAAMCAGEGEGEDGDSSWISSRSHPRPHQAKEREAEQQQQHFTPAVMPPADEGRVVGVAGARVVVGVAAAVTTAATGKGTKTTINAMAERHLFLFNSSVSYIPMSF